MDCPGPEQRQAFLRGDIDEEVAAHIECCEACQAALESLRDTVDQFQGQLRQAAREEAFTDDECRRALAPIEGLGDVPTLVPAADPSPKPAWAPIPTAPPEPIRLGNYILLHPVGEPSGQGVVWKARHAVLRSERAVKVLRPDRNGHAAVARFQREILATGELEHPNIVRAYDAGEADGGLYLVMEFLEGLSLSQLLKRPGPVPVPDACELIRQAAIGLNHAHGKKLVHRDIKPGNLMLTVLGEVKVLDFGLARLDSPDPAGAELTLSGQAMGTADYIAPEQVRDAHAADIRADLYSLGCTLYHLLAGQPPFGPPRYKTLVDKMHAHQHDPVTPVREFRPEVPDGLAQILDRLLAKERDERFDTPAELAVALKPFTVGCDLLALIGAERRDTESPTAPNDPPPGSSPRPAEEPGGRAMPKAGDDRPAGPEPPIVPSRTLQASLDVLFWDELGRRHVSITEPGALPVLPGVPFQIEARLNRPAFLYLVWITGEGQAQPLYPWEPGDWTKHPESEPVTHLLLPRPDPSAGYGTWAIEGPAGVETLVLMVRETPLPESFRSKLPGRLTGFPGRTALPDLRDVDRDHWFSCRDEDSLHAETKAVNFAPGPIRDPIFQIHSLLRDRLGTRFGLIRAVSFANLGP